MNVFHKFAIKSLKLNRTRTVVTIIGIILSTAMLTAVTTTVSSVQQFLLEVTEKQNGCWHGVVSNISMKQIDEISKKKEVEKQVSIQNIGYAKLPHSKNETSPYLYIGGLNGDYETLLPFYMKEGRMPKNENEIILPASLETNAGVSYQVGDVISLPKGLRVLKNKNQLWEDDSYINEDDETFVESGKTAYHVVGIYLNPLYDQSMAAGYHVFTKAVKNEPDYGGSIYVSLKDAKKTVDFLKQIKPQKMEGTVADPLKDTNRMYLIYSGNASGSVFRVLGGLMGILIAIIMFGSIALIGNSFSISVNERKRQYGLLSSIGATRKQLRRNVLYEASVLSAIGIPIGVLAGIGGMSVTFYFVSDLMSDMLNQGIEEYGEALRLHMSAAGWAVLLAALIGFFTVLISAYLPARKALRTSAIEVIRQSQDIKIRANKVKTWKLTGKLFGLEGTLASKNFKRNRKKYRATVFSLFVSVVLFISAASFCDYMSKAINTTISTVSCDIRVSDNLADDSKALYDKLRVTKGVTKSSYYFNLSTESSISAVVPDSSISEAYRNGVDGEGGQLNEPVDEKGNVVKSKTQLVDNLTVVFMENQAFDECVKQNRANGKFDALAYDTMSNQTRDGKMYQYSLFDKIPDEVEVCFPKKLPKHYEDVYERRVGKNGELECRMEKYLNEEAEPNSERFVPYKEFYNTRKITIGKTLDKAPFGMENELGYGLVLFMPERAIAKICPAGIEKLMVMLYNSDNPTETSEKMCQVLENNDRSTGNLYNYAREIQDVRAMMLVIKIFSYGFIILISLISIANVFNTISTNILLRRREFAVLRSVGMTRHGFYKMMNLECILYGCKGLFFGLIASVGVTYLIYLSLRNQIILDFYIPWYSVVIAVFSVFFVVFCTMLYAMRKIQKDNVAETLKSDVF